MIWNLLHTAYVILLWTTILLLLLMVGKIRLERSPKVHEDGRIELRPNVLTLCFFGLTALLFLLSTTEFFHHRSSLLANPAPICFGGWFLTSVFNLPASIVITEDGLNQVYWLRRSKHIAWNEIVQVNSNPKSHSISVTSEDGTKIAHFGFLSGRSRLLTEVTRHCGEKMRPDLLQ